MRTSRDFPHPFGFVLTLLAVVALPAFAGLNRWSGDSPGSGLVVRVIADPSDATHLYAITTGSKVVKSTDGGNTWRTAHPGLPAPSFSEFISPSANTLFAGANGGVFISTDGGDHWSKAGTINGNNVAPMAFDPKSQLLYAASNLRGVYVSVDIGKTWSKTSLTGWVTSLAVSAKGTVLAGTPNGVYKSSNRGRTWSVVRGEFCDLVEVDQNSAIYFFTRDSSGKQLFFVSSDEGATWRTLPSPSISPMSSVRVGDGYILNANVTVPAPGDLFALAPDGIFEYTDTSGKWVAVSPSITNNSPSSMAVIPSQPRKFIVSTDAGGLLVSDGNGWNHVTDGFGAAGVNDVVVGAAPSVAVAATDSGVFRTDDRGADWKDITPSAARRSTAAQVDPSGADVVYASTDAIFKSTDSGSSWKKVRPDPAKFLLVSPTDPKTIYAALYSALAKSSDSGESWSTVFLGLGGYAFSYYGGPTAIDEDPSNGNTLYIACGDGQLYRLPPDEKWTWVTTPVERLSVAPHESFVYAARPPGGVFKTYDQGKTWTPIGLTDKQISALMLTGSNRDVLYAGTVDGHVYRTADGGTTWQGVDAALERSYITKLASDPSGKLLYAASITGVHHYEVVDIPVDVLASDALRFPRLLNAAVGNAMVVLPVAGNASGASGTSYTTDLTLTNSRDSAQDVIISWLPQAGGGASSFHVTLPASSDESGGSVTIPDFSQSFAISGIGSLVIAAVDASGNADPNASITASADIWSHPADQRAPFSQSVAAVTRQSAIGHATAEIRGLQHDSAFRTNVGVVNLSGQAHRYEIAIEGERATNIFTVTVPPFSLIQVPLPDADYGALTINVTADASTDWAAYASTIDRVTGEARTNVQN